MPTFLMYSLQNVLGWAVTAAVLIGVFWGLVWAFDQSVFLAMVALAIVLAILRPLATLFSVYRQDVAAHKDW